MYDCVIIIWTVSVLTCLFWCLAGVLLPFVFVVAVDHDCAILLYNAVVTVVLQYNKYIIYGHVIAWHCLKYRVVSIFWNPNMYIRRRLTLVVLGPDI